jgi:tRNA-2-methylthio-N6-dimethylallyladenosine synthase
VRFLSSHPKDFSPRLIDVIASHERMCRHIHLPVQHGANSVLKAMNRRYTREDYLEKVNLIREKLPGSSLSTDILVGFPGETEQDVEDTLSLMKEARFEAAFTYYYNPREGTPAACMPDQIPLAVKKERLARVINAHLDIARSEMAKRVGLEVPVLVEGMARDNAEEYLGRTEQDGHVVFALQPSVATTDVTGCFVKVALTELTGNTFRGTLLESL